MDLSTPPTAFDFQTWTNQWLAEVESALSRWVTSESPSGQDHGAPAALVDAMRYAVLDGGKRLRPLLVMAACQAVGGNADAALRGACAVELIHAYSLVHDDMPCMDNDVLRRGKPTVHVKFGEAQALLAGDALQALAFELLTPLGDGIPGTLQANLCRILARAAGSNGMAGGQAIDLASVGKPLSEAQLREMHSLKTGALLHGSVMMGVACGQTSSSALAAMSRYGHAMGLAFQVVDDILDVTADSATLGKTAGKDADQGKPTYVSVLGMEQSRAFAASLLDQALGALQSSGLPQHGAASVEALRALAHMVVSRSH